MQEARGEGDGEGDPEHGAPAAAGGSQAFQPNPPRLPAAPGHLQRQCRRRRQIAPSIRAALMLCASGDRSWRFCLLLLFSQPVLKCRGNADCCVPVFYQGVGREFAALLFFSFFSFSLRAIDILDRCHKEAAHRSVHNSAYQWGDFSEEHF